jgi:hypothetical protein
MKAKATYTVKKWEEKDLAQVPPAMKITKASVEYAFSGDLVGTGSVEYLMFYRHFDPKDQHKAEAEYVGLIVFNVNLNGKTGAFVLEDRGAFEGGSAKSKLRLISGSGSAELKGITGSGNYLANTDGFRIELEYQL